MLLQHVLRTMVKKNPQSARVSAPRKPKKQVLTKEVQIRYGRQQRKVNRRGPISSSENYYLHSLMDPCHFPGVKIPDLVSLPSSTFTTENYGIATSNAAGDLAMVFTPRMVAQTFTQNAAGTTWTWPVGVSNPKATSVIGLYEQIRPVSMKVRFDYIGTTAADSGSIACALNARPASTIVSDETLNFPTTFAGLLSSENSYVAAARNGLESIWVPQDNSDLIYTNPSAGQFASTLPFNDKYQTALYPYLCFGASGLTASTASFRYTVTVNWEGLANQSTLAFVHTEASPSNVNHLMEAFNWIKAKGGQFANIVSASAPYVQTALDGIMAAGALGPALLTGNPYAIAGSGLKLLKY